MTRRLILTAADHLDVYVRQETARRSALAADLRQRAE